MSEAVTPRPRCVSAHHQPMIWVRALVVLLAVTSLAGVACSPSDESAKAPVAFVADDGRFRAEFPTTPKREEQRVPGPGTEVVFVMYAVETNDDSVGVGYGDYPFVADSAAVLDAGAEGAASKLNGKLESKTDISYLGHPAKDVVVTNSKGTFSARVFLVGNRMYMITAAAESGRPASYDHLIATFALL